MGQVASLQTQLEDKIGYRFRNPDLILKALNHNNGPTSGIDYERLAFISDSVIHFVITNYVYRKHPQASEGELTLLRAALLSNNRKTKIANQWELQKLVKLHYLTGVPHSIQFHSFYGPVIGAVFMDAGGEEGRGYEEADKVVYRLWSLDTRHRPPASNPGGNEALIFAATAGAAAGVALVLVIVVMAAADRRFSR